MIAEAGLVLQQLPAISSVYLSMQSENSTTFLTVTIASSLNGRRCRRRRWTNDEGTTAVGREQPARPSTGAGAPGSPTSLAVSASCQLSDMRRRYTRYFCGRAGIILFATSSESRRVRTKRISLPRCSSPPLLHSGRVLRPSGEEYNY